MGSGFANIGGMMRCANVGDVGHLIVQDLVHSDSLDFRSIAGCGLTRPMQASITCKVPASLPT